MNPTNAQTNQSHTEPVNQISTHSNTQPQKQPRVFTKLPIPLPVLFERLAQKGTLKPLQPTLLPQKLPLCLVTPPMNAGGSNIRFRISSIMGPLPLLHHKNQAPCQTLTSTLVPLYSTLVTISSLPTSPNQLYPS